MSKKEYVRYILMNHQDKPLFQKNNGGQSVPGGTEPFIIPTEGDVYDFRGFSLPVMIGNENVAGKRIRVTGYSFGGMYHHSTLAYIGWEEKRTKEEIR